MQFALIDIDRTGTGVLAFVSSGTTRNRTAGEVNLTSAVDSRTTGLSRRGSGLDLTSMEIEFVSIAQEHDSQSGLTRGCRSIQCTTEDIDSAVVIGRNDIAVHQMGRIILCRNQRTCSILAGIGNCQIRTSQIKNSGLIGFLRQLKTVQIHRQLGNTIQRHSCRQVHISSQPQISLLLRHSGKECCLIADLNPNRI